MTRHAVVVKDVTLIIIIAREMAIAMWNKLDSHRASIMTHVQSVVQVLRRRHERDGPLRDL